MEKAGNIGKLSPSCQSGREKESVVSIPAPPRSRAGMFCFVCKLPQKSVEKQAALRVKPLYRGQILLYNPTIHISTFGDKVQ